MTARLDIQAEVNAGLARLGLTAVPEDDIADIIAGQDQPPCQLLQCRRDAQYVRDNATDPLGPPVLLCLTHAAKLLATRPSVAKRCRLRRIRDEADQCNSRD